MKPITVGTAVARPREEVYDFLDAMSNHEPFTDHMLVDWTCSGPERGVGAKARMRAKAPGKPQWIDMEVKDAAAPERIVEEAVSAGGARRTRGTYTLASRADGGTDIHFRLEVLDAPPFERALSPLMRIYLQRANAKAMRRLHDAL